MKCHLLVNPGLEQLAALELKELINADSKTYSSVLTFEAAKEQLVFLAQHMQSVRRIILSLGSHENIDNIAFPSFPWKEFISPMSTLKIEVEGVEGTEKRLEIINRVAKVLFKTLEKEINITPKINLTTPDLVINVFKSGALYFIGLDLCKTELHERSYRVFPHHASFKGDLAYYFVRKSNLLPGKDLLIGFAKDGTLAIEAALYCHKSLVRKIPTILNELPTNLTVERTYPIIQAFDENQQNIIASRKNSSIAGTKNNIEFHKYSLDELDLKYNKEQFDAIIFYITTKDEDKLNEIYYQTKYLLKSGGNLLLIGREQFMISIPADHILLSEEKIERKENRYLLRLLQKS